VQNIASRERGPLWIGYAVPIVSGERQSCCWNNDSRGCGLEGQRTMTAPPPASGPIKLEGPTHATILLRVDGGQIGKIRAFSGDCPLDAGGLPVHWLTDVRPGESVALLAGQPGESATHAIAMHAGPEADKTLERLATAPQDEKVRRTAIFWLANSRGRRGFEVVNRLAREDSSEKVREHAIFALTQSKEPEAIPSIVRIAKEDKSPRVRGQALFWLAQRASRQAAATITDAIDRDPDTEVKKKAVFALSQMPKDEGVPLLIGVARNNANAAVRKQAMFWLGQSKDPRAVKFFEEILSK
jgi:HEAT repeat protein